ncbi:hypothetical protein CRN74_04065 [Yersinia frederiksenii]|jgi:hypothetical protein|nr:hypothetical protein CRN74_04065 [Yersinia frederiksenii]
MRCVSKSKTSLVDPTHEYYQNWTYQFYFLSYGFTLQADIHGNTQKKMVGMLWLFFPTDRQLKLV